MIKEAKNTRENPAQPVVTETIIQQEDTIDLVELFWVLVNHWKIILLTMLITAMLAGGSETILSGGRIHFYHKQ